MQRYQTAHPTEIEELTGTGRPLRPVRHHFGITTFGATTWTAHEAGEQLINEHDESDPVDGDELYLVLSGRARFEIDGDAPVDAPTGTFVAVAAGTMRTAFAEEPQTTLLAVGGGPQGRPYWPLGWEVAGPLEQLLDAERHEEVLAQAAPLLDAEPSYPLILYTVACSETALGKTASAIEHLRQAIDILPEIRDYLPTDPRLAALRDSPDFLRAGALE